jgi:hypothetical protein
MANQFRNYLLTVNNPTDTDGEFYERLKNLPHIKYFAFQREQGEEKATQHFQAYIEFEVGKTFATMKKYFPTAHIESRRGSKEQARAYCQKADTRMTGHEKYEFGEFAEERERTDLTDIIEMIRSGASESEIQDAYPGQFFRYYKNIQFLRQRFLEEKFKRTFRKVEVAYIYGDTEIGKTRYVMEKHGYENVYRMTAYGGGDGGERFDEYNGQDVVIFEEFRSSIRISDMLNYLDGYPLSLPARFNNKTACFTKVYIITNLPLREQYLKIQREYPSTWKAFLRRITRVYNFGLSKDIPVSKVTGTPYQTTADLKPLSTEEQEMLPF